MKTPQGVVLRSTGAGCPSIRFPPYTHTHHGKAARDGAAEMAHPLRGLVALAEFPAPTQKSSQTSMTLVPEDPVPSLTSPGTGHAYDAQTL